MALNFVAAEDGLEDGPKFLTLARLLKGPRALAFWVLMRLRRLIVNEGNALTGSLPKNYGPSDIAAFLEWSGRPQVLITSLKTTGFLGFRRGRGFFIPAWEKTTTGSYVIDRERRLAADRDRKKADRGGGEQGNGESVSNGRPVDIHGRPRIPHGVWRSIKEGRPTEPPRPPPGTGGLSR